MNNKKVAAVIPTRMASSRFPGKPLARILDLPMVEHVRRRVCLAGCVDEVYVATCDEEIMDSVHEFGGRAVMTANTHARCTDRVEEAMLNIKADIVVIVQGDEPLLDPAAIDNLVEPMLKDDSIECANLLSVIEDKNDLSNVDIVKAVLNNSGYVMYYSRAPIPYFRVEAACSMYRQTGLSAFKKDFLHKFSALEPTPKEVVESVDFLRILEQGYAVKGVIYPQRTVGVDRAGDVSIVEDILRNSPEQKDFYKRIMDEGFLKEKEAISVNKTFGE